MTIFLTLIHIVVCLVLIVVILVQGGRGQGLSGPAFSSGNVQSLFGTQAADFLTKATSVSAICFLFTCIGLNLYETHKSKSLLQGARQAAPVDIDAVKKALDKVKAEKGVTSESAKQEVSTIVDNAKKTAAETSKTVNATAEKAVADIKATAKEANAVTQEKASQAVAAVQAAASPAVASVKKEATKV